MRNKERASNKEIPKEIKSKKKKWKLALTLGLASGVIWGLISFIVYFLQFTDVGPSIYAKPVLNPDYVMKWQGHLIGVGFFIIYSVIWSFIYAALFIKIKTPWAGIVYGLFLWALVFIGLNWLLDLTNPVTKLGLNTNTVMICLYILIGLFIGDSLSVEFNNMDND